MKVKVSRRVEEAQRNLEEMPKRLQRPLKAVFKGNAEEFVKTFQNGIRTEDFNLRRLKVRTIARKASQGFPQPETPLYGLGDMVQDRSYINMLRIREVKEGFRVYVSKAMHWSKRISLYNLFLIHEYGATARGAGNSLIRIPARPALKKTETQFFRSEFYKKSKAKVYKIIKDYIGK